MFVWSLMVLTDSKVLALREGVSFQPLGNADGAILLIIETGQLYTCNITTARFLSAVDGGRNFAQVVDEVSGDFRGFTRRAASGSEPDRRGARLRRTARVAA